MKVLVTGASGLLGGRLAALLARRFDVVAGSHETATPGDVPIVPLDLLSASSVERALDESRPDAILHAAALADPDRCEREPERAQALNTEASRAVARLCRQRGLRLVALSTDLVFPGDRRRWPEDAPTRPLLTYGRTKRDGEEAVLAEDPGAVVARVALVHGRGHGPRSTASESVAWNLRAGRPVRLYTDQFRTPVDAESVAAAVEALLTSGHSGVFHLGGPERLSRYDLGVQTADLLGLDAALIHAVAFADQTTTAQRPADVSLDSSRAERELGWAPRPLAVGILKGRLDPATSARS